MKQNRHIRKVMGWILFLLAFGFLCLQLGYLFAHERFQLEYIDNRLFYIINIVCVICLFLAISLLLRLTKGYKLIDVSMVVVFIIVHVVLLVDSTREVKNITSVSPDFKCFIH